MHPEVLTALPPLLQYGALGLCALILVAWFWSVTQFVRVMERALEVIPGLTAAVNDLENEVSEVKDTANQVRDRMLDWKCTCRHVPDIA